ncbi:MAG: MFS transporter [Burkholderiaceae bacterium]
MSQPPIEPPPASWADLLSARNLLRSLALTGGIALHAVNIYIVTTVLPTVVREIGGLEYYAWSTTLFVVASIAGSVLATRLIHALGARIAYLLALSVFCVGAVGCAAASSMPWLLLGRTVQGLGGGLLFALAYALIRLIFEEALWGRVMALVSGVWGAATLLGPAIGGIFAQIGHWRWAFLAVLPVAAVLALIVIGQLDRKPAEGGDAGALPLGKIGLLVASVLAISLASLAPRPGWNVAGIGAGLALLMLMVALDRKAAVRLMPRGAYSLSNQLGAIYACMALLIVGISSEVFIPYFLQTIHGRTPLAAGYMTAFVSFGWTAASLLSSGRIGAAADRMVRLAPPILLASLLALMLVTPNPVLMAGDTGTALYCALLAAAGFGIGLGWPHLSIRVFNGARAGEETLAASSITTVQLYATALAAALAGVVANGAGITEPGGVAGAQNAAQWLFGAFAVAPALAMLLTGRILR